MSPVTILGAGMAGFGAAHRLHTQGVESLLYEKHAFLGGHSASFRHDNGFLFDDGPHISFTKNKRIQELFAESVQHEYQTIQVKVDNYWRGHRIKHPAQCNLYGLPTDLVVEVLRDFIDARQTHERPAAHYADWLLQTFGRTFSETFPMQYGLKYHTTTADNMTTDWIGPRLYPPSLEEVLRGALSPTTPDVYYVNHFRYPSRGGFVAFLNTFLKQTQFKLRHQIVALDPKARELRFANGVLARYESLISSIPLPDLVPMIAGVPADVLDAARALAATTCVVVNVGLDREDISPTHWTYFYDADFVFARVSFPHMQSPHNVPAGAGSLQAEVYYSRKYRPLERPADDCIEPVLRDLRRCGLLLERDTILFTEARLVPYANVIFDLDRTKALNTVHGFLDDCGIAYCGRYGQWGYHWTDESFESGEAAAQKVLDRG